VPSDVLAIIPARGGSKGIPRKNLASVGGVPLVVRSIRHAMAAASVTRVVVSTDDDEIAAVARVEGAEVVERPPELSGDTASSESALSHVLDHLRSADGYEPDLVVFLQATSPLRRPNDVDEAVAALDREGADSLFSACRLEGFVWRQDGSGLRSLTYDHARRPRRQEIGTDWLENGSIYVFKPWVLRESGNRLGGAVALFEMDPLDSFQVDEPGDVELMERIALCRPAASSSGPDLSRVRLLVLDFDGVMTDDRVLVHEDGSEAVLCHRGDGLGVERLRRSGVEVVVLSKERNPVVAARCRKLGISCLQAVDAKLPRLQALAADRGLSPAAVVYVGNDVTDLECVAWAGVGVAVADAHPEVRAAATWVTRRQGGVGAVREVCDAIIETRARAGT
jgi:YrbI family 3-deoxy-D-manno-octulosonate 8-phosphate phosphatase